MTTTSLPYFLPFLAAEEFLASDAELRSPPQTVGDDQLEWQLNCQKREGNNIDISLDLMNYASKLYWVSWKYVLTVKHDVNNEILKQTVMNSTSFFSSQILRTLDDPLARSDTLTVYLSVRFYRSCVYDLSDLRPNSADFPIKLCSENKVVYVPRAILGFHCAYFEGLFNLDHYTEHSQQMCELEKGPYWSFILILYQLHGIDVDLRSVNSQIFKDAVELADYLQCDTSIQLFEKHLLTLANAAIKTWFLTADRCRMVKLVRKILSVMTKDEITALTPHHQKYFSEVNMKDTVQDIMERMMELL
ncbi:hypothetical protein QR680_012263 [Steinernema hermaphroditum]|uniref:BTB domain-containing protein n=1 Tax=Steinernema hermaphroditum TaxID=289476 RepID=A0AA39I3S5_9BILA|nr:hypothetical protein QR680_012263 [Steinernema hermaphroditum]